VAGMQLSRSRGNSLPRYGLFDGDSTLCELWFQCFYTPTKFLIVSFPSAANSKTTRSILNSQGKYFLFDLLVEIFVVVVVISMSKIEKSLLNVLAY
jgi:hypothetical protein